ncbi:MAG: choice-of-anchor J domain-containing protein, partial [Bacteroidales bacterium]|nr:choice-of-anchor J domain-containing protein [Bacteroidales bacterium]
MKKLTIFLVLLLAIVSMNAQKSMGFNEVRKSPQKAKVLNLDVADKKAPAKRITDAQPFEKGVRTSATLKNSRVESAQFGEEKSAKTYQGAPSRAPIPGTTLLAEGFEGLGTNNQFRTGWLASPNPTSTNTTARWYQTNTTGVGGIDVPEGSRLARVNANATSAIDAMLYTPALTLTEGVTYRIEFDLIFVIITGTNAYPWFSVAHRTAQSETGGAYLFIANDQAPWAPYTNEFGKCVINFTPTYTGVHYFEFNVYKQSTSSNAGFVQIDDIRISAPTVPRPNDLAINYIFPFTQVPKSQIAPPLAAQVTNVGTNAQTEIKVEATLNDAPIGESATEATLAAGATQTFTVTPTTGTILDGTNTIKLTVSQDETDEDFTDNEITTTFIGTEHEYRVDNGVALGGLGFSTVGTRFGNIFTITAATTINAVEVQFTNTTQAAAATDFQVAMWPMDGNTPNWTSPTFAAVTENKPADFGGVIRVMTPATALSPGNYFVAVVRSADELGLSVDSRAVSGRFSYASDNDSEFAPIANTIVGAAFIRMLVDLPTDDVEVLAITSPNTAYNLTATEQVKVLVQNVGLDEITSLPLFVELDNAPAFNETFSTSIAPGTTAELTFTAGTLDLSAEATYEIKVRAELPGDINPENDVATKTVTNTLAPPIVPPFFDGFETTTGSALPLGWIASTEGTLGWHTTTGAVPNAGTVTPYAGSRFMAIGFEAGTRWAYSRGISLTGGATYKATFYYQAPGYSQLNEFDNFTVRIAQEQTSGAMQASLDTIFHLVNQRVNAWTLAEKIFTPTTSGTYYLGFNRTTPAGEGLYTVIDNVSIVEIPANEMAATAPVFPYTMIPTTQTLASAFTANVTNTGVDAQTNVMLTVDLDDTPIATSDPITVAGLGGTATLTATPTTGAAIATGTNTLTRTVTSDHFDGSTNPVAFTSTQTFVGTTNTLAVDNPSATTVNVNIAGANTRNTVGNVFVITEPTIIRGVDIKFNATTGGTPRIFLAPVSGANNTTVGTALIDNVAFNGTRNADWSTHTIAAPILLQPGAYFLGLQNNSGTANLGLHRDATAGKTFYTRTTGNLTAVTSTTANGAPCIRMIMADPCDAPFDLVVEPIRPEVKFTWDGDAPQYRLNVYNPDESLRFTQTTTATELLVALPGDSIYTWDVTGLCAALMTTNGGSFTVDPDTINFEMVDLTDFPAGDNTNLGKINPTLTIKNVSNTGEGYNAVEFEIFVNNVSIGIDETDIAAGGTIVYTSTLEVDLSAPGAYSVEARIIDVRDMIEDDNSVTVTGTNSTRDIAVTKIIAPISGSGLTATETVTIELENLGSLAITEFEVIAGIEYVVEGGTATGTPTFTLTATVETADGITIAPGATYELTFDQTGDFAAIGTYEFLITATLSEEDRDMSNNTLEDAVINGDLTDFMAVEIIVAETEYIAHTAPVDVTVRIQNRGTTVPAEVPVELWVNGILHVADILTDTDIPSSGHFHNHVFSLPVDISNGGISETFELVAVVNVDNDDILSNDTTEIVTLENTWVTNVAITALAGPTTLRDFYADEVPVTVTVTNNSNYAMVDMPIYMSINDEPATVVATVPNIAAGQALTGISLGNVSLEPGANPLVAWISVPNNANIGTTDTAKVTLTNTIDVRFNAWNSPATSVTVPEQTVTVVLQNNGTFRVRNIPIQLTLNDDAPIPATIDTIIRVAQATSSLHTYTFASPITLNEGANTLVLNVVLADNTASSANQTGTRTVTYTNPVASVPYFEGFDATTETNLPTFWDRSGTAPQTWHTTTGSNVSGWGTGRLFNPFEGTRCMVISYNAGPQWGYSRGVQLTGGTQYRISFMYMAPGWDEEDGSPIEYDNFTVRIAQDASATAMTASTDTILHHVNKETYDWTLAEKRFTPATSGVYYLGFNRITPANQGAFIAIDNVAMAEPDPNDLAIVVNLPYTQIPTSQFTSISAQARNQGTAVQTNVKLSATINGTLIGESDPVASIAPETTSAMMTVILTTPLTEGAHTLVMTVAGDQTNEGTENTATRNFTGTENVFAQDILTAPMTGGGVGFPDPGGTFAVVYEITQKTYLSGIRLLFATGGSTLSYTVAVRPMTSPTTMAATPIATRTQNRVPGLVNVDFSSEGIVLMPGLYAVTMTAANNVGISYDESPTGSWYTTSGNNLNYQAGGQGFGALGIRLLIDDTPTTITATFPADEAEDVPVNTA